MISSHPHPVARLQPPPSHQQAHEPQAMAVNQTSCQTNILRRGRRFSCLSFGTPLRPTHILLRGPLDSEPEEHPPHEQPHDSAEEEAHGVVLGAAPVHAVALPQAGGELEPGVRGVLGGEGEGGAAVRRGLEGLDELLVAAAGREQGGGRGGENRGRGQWGGEGESGDKRQRV